MDCRFEHGAVCLTDQVPEPFFCMCDGVHLAKTNALGTSMFGPGRCLMNADPSILVGSMRYRAPARAEFYEMFVNASEMSLNSPLWKELPVLCEGVPRHQVLAALFLFTMQGPYPVYRLITDVFAKPGKRELFKEQQSFMKLLLIAHRSIPRGDGCLYRHSGPLFFGFGHHPDGLSIPDVVEQYLPVGKSIFLPAPTFCSASADVIMLRYPEGVCFELVNSDAIRLVPGVLSSFSETEYLPAFPLKVLVKSCKKVGTCWSITLEALVSSHSDRYLSIFKPTSIDEEDFVQQHFREKKYLTVRSMCALSSLPVARESALPSTSICARFSNSTSCPSIGALKAPDIAAIVGFHRNLFAA
jgi:hypothetical protein